MKSRLTLKFFFVTLITASFFKAIVADDLDPELDPIVKAVAAGQAPNLTQPLLPLDQKTLLQKTLVEQKIRDAAPSGTMKHSWSGSHGKQNKLKPETKTQPNAESKEQDKTTEKKDSSILEFHGILPESVIQGSTDTFEEPQDQITKEQLENVGNSDDKKGGNGEELEEKTEKLSTLFGISFDKKQLMYYGAGAVAIVIFCGVTYVLYKNGTLKKIGDYIGNYIIEHQFKVRVAVGTACIFALAGIYAKQQGITMQDTSTWITTFWN